MADEHINRQAPDLKVGISPETEAVISERTRAGYVSPYATPDAAAIRRESAGRDIPSALRPAFQRDIQKIMHTPAYNRLAQKTQVFSFRKIDDLTRRGLHVQLVSRVARDIGRALGLNIDLIEAIALGHDLGHTPFGHAGEDQLNRIMMHKAHRRFLHNVQSVRVLDVLYGRNLTLQTLDGILCHNGECELPEFTLERNRTTFDTFDQTVAAIGKVGSDSADGATKADGMAGSDAAPGPAGAVGATGADAPGAGTADAPEAHDPTAHLRPITLEGAVVRISDIIAYVGKDRQDALVEGLVKPEDFDDGLGGYYNTWALEAFISDVVEQSIDQPSIKMSPVAFAELKRAKAENYQKVYQKASASIEYARLSELFDRVFDAAATDLARGDECTPIFAHHIKKLEGHTHYYGTSYAWEDEPLQTVADFVASMSDDYFMSYVELLEPQLVHELKELDYFDGLKQRGWRPRP